MLSLSYDYENKKTKEITIKDLPEELLYGILNFTSSSVDYASLCKALEREVNYKHIISLHSKLKYKEFGIIQKGNKVISLYKPIKYKPIKFRHIDKNFNVPFPLNRYINEENNNYDNVYSVFLQDEIFTVTFPILSYEIIYIKELSKIRIFWDLPEYNDIFERLKKIYSHIFNVHYHRAFFYNPPYNFTEEGIIYSNFYIKSPFNPQYSEITIGFLINLDGDTVYLNYYITDIREVI